MNTKTASILIVVFLLAGAAIYFIFSDRETVSGPVACTMEALACPDGSFVGRTGPQCQFSACPNSESLVGVLREMSNGYELILPAPEGIMGQEVSYIMPLEIEVGIPENWTDRLVRVSGRFTYGNTLKVESMILEGELGNPELGDVKVGQSVFVNGVRITLDEIVQDSRCPIDVVCIWAGAVTVKVTLKSDTDEDSFEIVSDSGGVSFDAFGISIQEVRPPQMAGVPTPTEDYTVVFKVVANQ